MYSNFLVDQDFVYPQEEHISHPFKDNINLNLKLGSTMGKSMMSPIQFSTFNREIDLGLESMRLSTSSADIYSNSDPSSPTPYMVFDSTSTRHSSDVVSEPPSMCGIPGTLDHFVDIQSNMFESINMEPTFTPDSSKIYYGNNFTFGDSANALSYGQYSHGFPGNATPLDFKAAVKINTASNVAVSPKTTDESMTFDNYSRPLPDKRLSNDDVEKCSHFDDDESNKFLSSQIDIHKLVRSFKCPVVNCPFNLIGFEKKALLRHHLISQHFKKGLLLPECYQYRNTINSLIYKCNDSKCGKCFYRRDSLSRHIKLVHNNKFSKFNRKIAKEKQTFTIKRRTKS